MIIKIVSITNSKF